MKIIYESKKPKFAIAKDSYQWIICYEVGSGKLKGKWVASAYYPNLSNLFDGLAEDMFRNFTGKIKQIKELDKSIDKVYALIDKVSKQLEKR